MIDVIVIDDDPVSRFGIIQGQLSHYEHINVIDSGEDGSDALPLYKKHINDNPVVLLDLDMKRNGIFSAEDIIRFHPDAKIIAYSSAINAITVAILKEIGILGFVKKGPSSNDIIPAIESVNNNIYFYCSVSMRITPMLNTHYSWWTPIIN